MHAWRSICANGREWLQRCSTGCAAAAIAIHAASLIALSPTTSSRLRPARTLHPQAVVRAGCGPGLPVTIT
jgi:hypothetical protein